MSVIGYDPAVPDTPSAAPLATRDEVEAAAAKARERAEEAQAQKRRFLGLIQGAKVRVGVISDEAGGNLRALGGNLAFAAADIALMHIVNGNVEFKDAKQAADVAKALFELGKSEVAATLEDLESMTPDQREKYREGLRAGVKDLQETLQERARQLNADGDAGDFGDDSGEVVSIPVAPVFAIIGPTPPEQTLKEG